MTYLSVIAAASAAALVAGAVNADVASGHAAGKRVHKPATAALKAPSKTTDKAMK